MSAANSMLSVPIRKPAQFSQTQPPWNQSETITIGAEILIRSSIAVSLLQRHGLTNVSEIAGGTAAWEAAGLPLVPGETSPV